jgi:hypothetical protein
MKQIKIRWGDLGLPTQPSNYHGLYTVRVTRGDIELTGGKPDALLIAIQAEFFFAETPYIITHVEFPGK